MNNALNFYNGNKQELFNMTGISGSNYEFEMISTISEGTKNPIDAIDIILDMAKTGRIDPWNIDIVKVYDEYMKKLAELNAQNNLKFVGRGFVFASILLNLKSKVLSGLSLNDFEVEPSVDEDFMEDYIEGEFEPEQEKLSTNNVISFEEVLQRRTSTKMTRSRAITLNDLIRHLKFYEELEHKRKIKSAIERTEKRIRNYSKLTTGDILDMAQDEYIEELVEKLNKTISLALKKEEKIELETLKNETLSKSAAYIAVLYLCSRGKYEIEQKEFYGDLFIKMPNESVAE